MKNAPTHPAIFLGLLLAFGFAGSSVAESRAPEDKRKAAAKLIRQGDALDAEWKTGEALAVYLEAEKLTPEDPYLLNQIAKQYAESMVDLESEAAQLAAGQKALDYAQRSVTAAPDFAESHLSLAICYGRLLDFAGGRQKVEYSRKVKEQTEKALALDDSLDYGWHMLGRWHREVVEVGPVLRGIVALVYGGLPDASLEESAKAFEKAVELNPGRVSHHVELGITYASLDRPEEARELIERGLALPSTEKDDPDTKARGREVLATLGE